MANPLTTKRNKYYQNPKDSSVMTPKGVADFLYLLTYHLFVNVDDFIVLDPCCGSGNLLAPFKHKTETIGIDLESQQFEVPPDLFVKHNFLDIEKGKVYPAIGEESDYDLILDKPGLVLCNPPFNTYEDNRTWMKEHNLGKALLPEVFADKIFELYGDDVRLILFVPMGMRLNQRTFSKRWRKMRDKYPDISSIISLPLNIFPNVEFHNEILIFNIDGLKPHYFLPEMYLENSYDI
jgi:type I restriction enzyme M protein